MSEENKDLIPEEEQTPKTDSDSGELDLDAIKREFSDLSDTDRDVLSDTKMIHTDRGFPDEATQAIHILTLDRQRRERNRKVLIALLVLMALGIFAAAAGIRYNRNKLDWNKINAAAEAASAAAETTVAADDVTVAITEETFPDAVFRDWVSAKVDTDGDGTLSASEINALIIMNLSDDDRVTSLKGIENFVALQALNVDNTSITELDLSGNVMLKSVQAVGTGLTRLDVSNNPELVQIDIRNTQVAEIILPEESRITDLKTDGTSLTCTKDESTGIFTGCAVQAAAPEPTATAAPAETAVAEEAQTDTAAESTEAQQ